MIPPAVSAYWRRAFGGGQRVFDDGAVSLTIDSGLSPARAAMVLQAADGGTQVALTPAIAGQAGLADPPLPSLPTIRERLARAGFVLNDPDLLFYRAAAAAFLPPPDEAHVVRPLTVADRAAFDRFRDSATPQDLDDAWVEFDHPVLFGSFVADRLVCAASTLPWDRSALADLGVLTLPDMRGRGHARAVVAAIGRHVSAIGQELQYRCQTDNMASIALARAAGLLAFGTWEVLCVPVD